MEKNKKIAEKAKDEETKLSLLKTTVCKELEDGEISLFLYTCKRFGLDPFAKQIYAIKRWNSKLGKKEMTIQISIDGFRLVADRTGRFAPGKDTVFSYDKDGQLVSATSYVKKMSADGTWHEYSGAAMFNTFVGRDKKGEITSFWKKMPEVMLEKVAESRALRRGFPAELSGVYTDAEMQQAESQPDVVELITQDDRAELELIIDDDQELLAQILNILKVESVDQMPSARFEGCKNWLLKHVQKESDDSILGMAKRIKELSQQTVEVAHG